MALLQTPTAVECLYSTVRNIALTEKFFGFLPPHGRRLACGEELTVWGDIQHWLTRFTPNDRARRSLQVALAGDSTYATTLALVNTPSVHLFDAGQDETKILTLVNGTFTMADPCWGSYSSESLVCTDGGAGIGSGPAR
jgi:hypothetical protein